MKVLVLGSGAREHALAWKLRQSSYIQAVFAGPGNAGTAEICVNLPDVEPMDFQTVLQAARTKGVDCVFVGPEAPLAAGIGDYLHQHGMAAFGPGKRQAQLESSKTFSKAFLLRSGIPTAHATEFVEVPVLEEFLAKHSGRTLVVKKSGLASGKGVLASSEAKELLSFGREILATDRLLVEEFLEGWELSVFAVSDGNDHLILPACTDFKKAYEGDNGPNTGGMGSICPVPTVDESLLQRIDTEVVRPTFAAMAREGLTYSGVLYFGLMITSSGPKVLEYNVRLGDPETQVLLPVLSFDLGELLHAVVRKKLSEFSSRLKTKPARGSALGVVIASKGYPIASAPSAAVRLVEGVEADHTFMFHASTLKGPDGVLRTHGGRCFTVVGVGSDLRSAANRAYTAADRIRFDGCWYRRDIGQKFIGEGK
jgi:phosphoribosylamine--glycine ligase